MDEKTVRTLRNACRIPSYFLRLEICDMDSKSRVQEEQLKFIEREGNEISTNFKYVENPIFFWIQGKYGTGKTRIATWLVKQAYLGMKGKSFPYDFDFRPLFMSTSNITEYRFKKLNSVSDDDFDYGEMRDRIFNCSFLAIDDIGKIASYKGEKQFIERVIEERWNEQLSTIITSNVDAKEISVRFEDFITPFKKFTMIGRSRKERENE